MLLPCQLSVHVVAVLNGYTFLWSRLRNLSSLSILLPCLPGWEQTIHNTADELNFGMVNHAV